MGALDILTGADGGGSIGGFSLNFGNFFSVILNMFKWLGVFGVLAFVVYYFFLRPAKYKDIVEIWDLTGGGIVVRSDRGMWKEDRTSGTGYYTLLKDKRARLKHPPLEHVLPTKKGKYKFTFVKKGSGPFDYESVPQKEMAQIGKLAAPIPLADLAWAKYAIKKAAEKKVLGGFWEQNKPAIITITTLVIVMIILVSLFRAIPDAAQAAASTISAQGSQYAAAIEKHANALNEFTSKLAGATPTTLPPEGFD